MDLRRPEALLLLPVVLALALLAARRSVVALAPWRSRVSNGARVLLLVVLVLVLAEARAVLPRDELHVVFCADRSASLDPQHLRFELDWIADAAKAMTERDRAALIVFGEDAQVERPLSPILDVPHDPESLVARDATDLGRAIRLSLALATDDVERQIVLLSDGNENAGDALREARIAAASGVRVTTVHVASASAPGEVLVERLDAPPFAEKREPFLVRATIVARSAARVRVAFERNGRLLDEREVSLPAGKSTVSLPQRLDEADAWAYRVTVSAAGDGNPANNQGMALVRVLGEPRALVVLREKTHGAHMARALERTGMKVDRGGAADLPLGRDELARYDLVVTGNIAADRWSPAQLTAVRDYVRDMGGGLVALGGEESFGLGGFYGTPFEEALPVDSDVRRKKVMPSLALVLCIDKSGSMTESTGDGAPKIALAREGAVRTIQVLSREDMIGVIGFDHDASWIAELRRADDKVEIARAVRTLEAGGGTAFFPALELALAGLEKVDAKVKHVVLLTDGISGEPLDIFAPILDRCRRGKVTLSTLGVGEDAEEGFLRELAARGGGRSYFTRAASAIPNLLTKDAMVASRSLLVERPFRPVELAPSDLGFRPSPPLLGFVLTEAKEGAEVLLGSAKDMDPADEGPILARWRFGIGKSAAFTSDADARWSQEWLDWPGYDTLFGNLARWTERDPRPAGLAATLELESGSGVVTVEADESSPVALEARLSVPAGAAPVAPFPLDAVAPGRYRGRFPATRPGAYFVGIEEVQPSGARVARGTAAGTLAYPREYRDLQSNPGLLERIARITGGKALSLEDRGSQIWRHERPPTRSPRPLLPWLVAAAAALLALEVAARRLAFPEELRARVRELGRRRSEPSTAPDAVIEKLLAKKVETRAAAPVSSIDLTALPVPAAPPTAPVAAREPARVEAPPPPVVPRERVPEEKKPDAAPDPDDDSFTSQLLKAKRRARRDDEK